MRRRVRGVSDVVVPERRVTGSGGTCWDGTGSEGDLDGACEGGRGEPGQAEPGRVPHVLGAAHEGRGDLRDERVRGQDVGTAPGRVWIPAADRCTPAAVPGIGRVLHAEGHPTNAVGDERRSDLPAVGDNRMKRQEVLGSLGTTTPITAPKPGCNGPGTPAVCLR